METGSIGDRIKGCEIPSCSSTKPTDVLSGLTDGVASLGIQDDRHVFLLDSGASNYIVSCRE